MLGQRGETHGLQCITMPPTDREVDRTYLTSGSIAKQDMVSRVSLNSRGVMLDGRFEVSRREGFVAFRLHR